MIKEVELNLFVPSSELLVRLASGNRPLGVPAGPPRIRVLRETYFDTEDQVLRKRGMTCRLSQGEGQAPSVVVTLGEGPDSEGITSRSRLTASAVGAGVFESLRGNSEPADQIRKFADPGTLRPQVAIDIQRLGRVMRTRILRRSILLLFFDRVTVQVGRTSSVFHELRVLRRRGGGPLIRDIAKGLRDQHHLFPDGLSTLQRAHRIMAMGQRQDDPALSPYALNLALALFRDGELGLLQRNGGLAIPTFRGSGEDAARALLDDLTGEEALELVRLGTTEPREGRPALEVWAGPSAPNGTTRGPSKELKWVPWHGMLESLGSGTSVDQDTLPALLLLSRRRLLGQLAWIPAYAPVGPGSTKESSGRPSPVGGSDTSPEIRTLNELLPTLAVVEDPGCDLEVRLRAAGGLAENIAGFFVDEVRTLKERILSGSSPTDSKTYSGLLDLLCVRVRGITDRLYGALNSQLIPGLEERGVHLRAWAALMHQDRRSVLEAFSRELLPSMSVVADWGPALVPEMPPAGCALGLTARERGAEGTRFFHLVLDPGSPSFLRVPKSPVVLPLEEVVQGFLFSRYPSLEKAETYLFRFRTAEITVGEEVPNPAFAVGTGFPGSGAESLNRFHGMEETAEPERGFVPEPNLLPLPVSRTIFRESKQSVVVRVVTRPRMPESHQAQLLRALERKVALKRPLIGWSDLYPVPGPMSLAGLPSLLDGE